MSNWEPENVSDADMENIAGGTGNDSKKASQKSPSVNKPILGGADPKEETGRKNKGNFDAK